MFNSFYFIRYIPSTNTCVMSLAGSLIDYRIIVPYSSPKINVQSIVVSQPLLGRLVCRQSSTCVVFFAKFLNMCWGPPEIYLSYWISICSITVLSRSFSTFTTYENWLDLYLRYWLDYRKDLSTRKEITYLRVHVPSLNFLGQSFLKLSAARCEKLT